MKTRLVEELPGDKCDFCHLPAADEIIDGPTRMGPWAHMCRACWATHGNQLSMAAATIFIKNAVGRPHYTKKEVMYHANNLSEDELENMMFERN